MAGRADAMLGRILLMEKENRVWMLLTFSKAKLTVRALRRLGVHRRVRRRLELPHPQRPRRSPRHAPRVRKAR